MTKPIKVTVSGTDYRGGDAPTVEDLLAQIKDFVHVLREVEDAVSDTGRAAVLLNSVLGKRMLYRDLFR